MATKEEPLTPEQISTYLRDGVLVVPSLLTAEETREAMDGLEHTISKRCGVDVRDLAGTGHRLKELSSTNGAGGVLDVFYPDWKMKIATNERLFRMTTQLWKAAYCHSGESIDDLSLQARTDDASDDSTSMEEGDRDGTFKWHPYGAFHCDQGYMYSTSTA